MLQICIWNLTIKLEMFLIIRSNIHSMKNLVDSVEMFRFRLNIL